MKIRYEKKNEIKTDHFWNLPNINDTISNYATNVEHLNYKTERKIMSGNMKIWYEKKNEIKKDHFWNLPNIDGTISNYFVVMQRNIQ